MTLPNFLIVGANRAGTSYLASLLVEHAQVFLPRKELHYFDQVPFRGGEVAIEDYARFFEGADGQPAVGEKTPSYMYFDHVPGLLATYLPDARLIFLLRDPLKRAHSQYWKRVRNGQEPYAFERALREEPARLARGTYIDRIRYSYQDRGLYMRQIERFLPLYPRERMLFLASEDMFARPRETLETVLSFLGISAPPQGPIPEESPNHSAVPRWPDAYRRLSALHMRLMGRRGVWRVGQAAQWARDRVIPKTIRPYPPMKEETAAHLAEVFREDSSALREFLGGGIDHWSVFRYGRDRATTTRA